LQLGCGVEATHFRVARFDECRRSLATLGCNKLAARVWGGKHDASCLFAVVFALFALSLHTCAQAQDAQQPRMASGKTEPDDVAEQLVVQVHGWFTNLAAQGKIPRVFTGISPDARQFIVELDSLTFDDVKRREFII
jgi:hypothetical protein